MSIKQHAKSKTQWLNAAVLVIGVIELNAHMLQDTLGQYYGAAFILIACAGAYMRSITTGAISDK